MMLGILRRSSLRPKNSNTSWGRSLALPGNGNCEQMRNTDGSPNTAHTSCLVHFIYVANNAAKFRCEDGILADVAPTLLFLLGLAQPKEMTGHNLLVPM